jgi:hypothetical protein
VPFRYMAHYDASATADLREDDPSKTRGGFEPSVALISSLHVAEMPHIAPLLGERAAEA